LIQMYGEVVDGIDAHRFEQALTDLKARREVTQDVELTADDLAALVETFKRIYHDATGRDFPQDPRDQLRRAVRAVFDSWETPRAFEQLVETMRRLEGHYRDMQDIEFTVEDGALYLLQTRSAKRTAAAALRCAVDMVDEGVISRDEAVARIDPAQLDQLLHPM